MFRNVCYAEHAQEHKHYASNGDTHLYPRTGAQRERELCEFEASLILLSKFQVSQGLYSKILFQRKKGRVEEEECTYSHVCSAL